MNTIGFYDDSRNRAGTVQYLAEIINRIDRSSFTPIFFSPHRYTWQQDLTDLGIQIITPDVPILAHSTAPPPNQLKNLTQRKRMRSRLPAIFAWWLGSARDIEHLVSLFKKHPVDIMHLNNTGAETAPIAAKLAGVPHILGTWHVDSTYDLTGARSGWNYRLLEKMSMHSLHKAIAVSEATKMDWKRRCGLSDSYMRRVNVVYNGVNPERLKRRRTMAEAKNMIGINPETLVIGSLGRIAPEKGYEHLIRALKLIRDHFSNVAIIIGGRGPLENELKGLTENIGLKDSVYFLGFREDVRDILEATDIYVQPSLCEAQPIALLEAMAMHLPIVGTDAGGIPETIMDKITGLIVPKRDSYALSQAILTLLGNPEISRDMGIAGYKRVCELFTSEKMIMHTMEVYVSMLERN